MWAPAFAPHHPGPCIDPKSLSSRQFHFWKPVAPSSPSALARVVPVYPLNLPGVIPLGAAMGFWSLCSKGNGIHSQDPSTFSAVISFVCVREVESCGITKNSHSILPGRWVCSEPVFAQSRGPLGCHRVCKASFCGLKKAQQIMELHFSFQIRRPGTRDHKGLIQSHTALTLTHLLIPLLVWWMLGWGPAQDQLCSFS